MNPVCPHCRQEITFTKALKIGNPFFFKCPLCKTRIKQFSFGLLLAFVIVVLLAWANVSWVIHEIAQEDIVQVLISLFVFVSWLIGLEYLTHKYFAKHGVLKNEAT
jgi:hypothetical protein